MKESEAVITGQVMALSLVVNHLVGEHFKNTGASPDFAEAFMDNMEKTLMEETQKLIDAQLNSVPSGLQRKLAEAMLEPVSKAIIKGASSVMEGFKATIKQREAK